MSAGGHAMLALEGEFEDHLTLTDRRLILSLVLTALREPDARTLAIFIEELADHPGQTPDPSTSDRLGTGTAETRLRLTWAWRRAIDHLKAQIRDLT